MSRSTVFIACQHLAGDPLDYLCLNFVMLLLSKTPILSADETDEALLVLLNGNRLIPMNPRYQEQL